MSTWQIIQEDVLIALAEMEKRGEKFDCVVMDPPYCSGGLLPQQIARGGVSKYSERTDLGDFEDGMSQLAFFRFMIEVFTRSKRVLNQPGYLFSFIDWRSYPVISEALEGGGVRWLGTCVWNKGNSRPNPGQFFQDCEFVLWGTNGREKTKNFGGHAVIDCRTPLTAERIHPTQKPPFVYSKLYGILNEKPRILELFSGSASGGVAALEMGADYVGVESSPYYVAASRKRLREAEEKMKFLSGE